MRLSNVLKSAALALGCLASVLDVSCVYGDVLIADRLSNSVYRYSDSGVFLNTVLSDSTNLDQPSGIQISPDGSKIYVSSSMNSQVVQYDYNGGIASNASVFANTASGLRFPSSVLFSQDGSRIYVSNLGGTGVAQFNTDGTSAGLPINGAIGGGAIFQYSGLAFAPNGSLLVGGFRDFPAEENGAVAISNPAITGISDYIGPSPSLDGASGLLVHNQSLYVTGLWAGTLQKFDIDPVTGLPTLDSTFNSGTGIVSGLSFPQGLMLAPDGNGLLMGILGNGINVTGSIARYGFDGSFIGTFATPGGGGFSEATSFVYAVPEPSVIWLTAMGCSYLGLAARRRFSRNKSDASTELAA